MDPLYNVKNLNNIQYTIGILEDPLDICLIVIFTCNGPVLESEIHFWLSGHTLQMTPFTFIKSNLEHIE